jgi:Flp pilus assembly pilin Flp
MPPADGGAAAVEYGFLVSGIATVVLVITVVLGTWVKGVLHETCDRIDQTGTGVMTGEGC